MKTTVRTMWSGVFAFCAVNLAAAVWFSGCSSGDRAAATDTLAVDEDADSQPSADAGRSLTDAGRSPTDAGRSGKLAEASPTVPDARDSGRSCPPPRPGDASIVWVPHFSAEASDGTTHEITADSFWGRALYTITSASGVFRYHVLEYFDDILVVYNHEANPENACEYGVLALLLDAPVNGMGAGSTDALFCKLDDDALTPEEALRSTALLDRADQDFGCNGSAWTSLRILEWLPDAGADAF